MRERRADRLDFVGQPRVVEACAAPADRLGVATGERRKQTRRRSCIADTYLANADGGCVYGDYLDALPTDA